MPPLPFCARDFFVFSFGFVFRTPLRVSPFIRVHRHTHLHGVSVSVSTIFVTVTLPYRGTAVRTVRSGSSFHLPVTISLKSTIYLYLAISTVLLLPSSTYFCTHLPPPRRHTTTHSVPHVLVYTIPVPTVFPSTYHLLVPHMSLLVRYSSHFFCVVQFPVTHSGTILHIFLTELCLLFLAAFSITCFLHAIFLLHTNISFLFSYTTCSSRFPPSLGSTIQDLRSRCWDPTITQLPLHYRYHFATTPRYHYTVPKLRPVRPGIPVSHTFSVPVSIPYLPPPTYTCIFTFHYCIFTTYIQDLLTCLPFSAVYHMSYHFLHEDFTAGSSSHYVGSIRSITTFSSPFLYLHSKFIYLHHFI